MTTLLAPARSEDRQKNPLRPERLDEIVGQERAKKLLRRAVESTYRLKQPLPHTLFVGAGGTGKSTFSHALANEIHVDVWDLEAPVSFDTLMELRTQMQHFDILKIEEIHQQGIMERRGRSSATQPEVLYSIMEDRVIPTEHGILPYPKITLIGTTTDEGMLPDSFIQRFTLRPPLVAYSREDLMTIGRYNARVLGLKADDRALAMFAEACRRTPRQLNNYMRTAQILSMGIVDEAVALEVLDSTGTSPDGLTSDMQAMLRFLYTRAKHVTGDGDVKYQASVGTIATAIGKSRDAKAISLRVEPWLIERGYVQVTHGGRRLTDAGIERARQLV